MKAKLFLSILFYIFVLPSVYSQVSVNGPTCTVPDVPYRYTISGMGDSASTMKVCVSGGHILNNVLNCIETSSINLLKISWDSSSENATIRVYTSTGNATLNVNITQLLKGGYIDSLLQVQTVDTVTTPVNLLCTTAVGGNCTPLYQYQWQKSPDNLEWTDVIGQTEAGLRFTTPLKETTYFRRKTTESTSNTIAYSNIALIIVNRKSSQL